ERVAASSIEPRRRAAGGKQKHCAHARGDTHAKTIAETGPRGYWTIIQSPATVRWRRSEVVGDGVEERERLHADLGLEDGQVAGAGRQPGRGSELVARAHRGAEV